MSKIVITSPGTVSRILWHFTGGPAWNEKEKKQNKEPKSAAQAYENLKGILESRELRVGNYKEIVRITIPERRTFNIKTRKVEIEKDARVELTSAPVCCLSDIPIAHLAYHAYRYGKFAIGYHRTAVLGRGFNPVFYTLQNKRIIRSIYEGYGQLESIDFGYINNAIQDIQSDVDEVQSEHDIDVDVSSAISDIEMNIDDVETYITDAKDSFKQFLAYIKTFEESEFGTIYCEREWRSTKTYSFEFDDVAMIVLPKKVGRNKYFDYFINRDMDRIGIPRTIPVVPWEDLVEH